jgi:hypothetical protein
LQTDVQLQTVYEAKDPPERFLDASKVLPVLRCGLTPTFDRMDATLLAASIWSWDVNAPSQTLQRGMCAVATAASGGRWTDVTCASEPQHYHACVAVHDRSLWMVSKRSGPWWKHTAACGLGYIHSTPSTAAENTRLLQAMIGANVTQVLVHLCITVLYVQSFHGLYLAASHTLTDSER